MLGEGAGHLCLPLRMNYLLQAGASIRSEMVKPASPTLLFSSLSMHPLTARNHNKYSSHHILPDKDPVILGGGELKAGFNYFLAWRMCPCHHPRGVENFVAAGMGVSLSVR